MFFLRPLLSALCGILAPVLVSLKNILKYYGAQTVLEDLNFSLHAGERIALVGRNGAGKSTLLKLITTEEEPSAGEVLFGPHTTVGMLRQDPDFDSKATIFDVIESAFHELDALEEELEHLQSKLDNASTELLEHYHERLEHYQLRGGYERRARRDGVLLAFGFRGREYEAVGSLSGGEKTRLGLAALLVQNPEILLLDEPTNHLDIAMREWLEQFLKRYTGAMIVVSHDRAFLDVVASKTAYLRDKQLKVYSGNYSSFKTQLTAELEQQMHMFEAQQRKIDAFKDSIELNKVWARKNSNLFKRVKAMEKRLDRMQDTQIDAPPPEEDVADVHFDCDPSGEIVLEAKHLSKSFAGRSLFKDVALTIRKGERLALIGENGAGKSTLLRCILGLSDSDDPRAFVRTGSRVRVGYYDQQLRGVDPESSLFDEVLGLVAKTQEARNLLGAYLFPYDSHSKKVKDLSGGERARLALLKLSLQRYNFLVLDEPTNHLDMEMLETLEQALSEYGGTLLMVSHDRAFVQNLASKIWLIEDGAFYEYLGDYAYYKYKHQKATVLETPKPKPKKEKTGKSLWHTKRRFEEVETEIATAENLLQQHHTALSQPGADFATLGKDIHRLEQTLETLMQEWEDLGTQIAEAESP